MTIEGVGSVDPLGNDAKVHKNKSNIHARPSDAIDVSAEARVQGAFDAAKAHVHGVDDIRADRIEAAKGKIDDPNYFNDPDVINTIADRISDLFLG